MPSVKEILKAAGEQNLSARKYSHKPTKRDVVNNRRVKAIAGQRKN